MDRAFLSVVRTLALALEAKDVYTFNHSRMVHRYSIAIGKHLGLKSSDLQDLEVASVLHDVGKIAVREDVLNKAGALTCLEWEHVKQHPVVSERILATLEGIEGALPIIRHHHERFDGTGYPDRLAGEAIPLGARIIAVGDAYDAMTSVRAFRGAKQVSEAVDELKAQSGSQFDPAVVDAFLACIDVVTQRAAGSILVVDDEEVVRRLIRRALEQDGHTVTEAAGAMEAIQLVQEGAFDLMILDIRMPEMDGVEALPLIRELERDLPVVICTAEAEAADDLTLWESRISSFIQKPVHPDVLRAEVARALTQRVSPWLGSELPSYPAAHAALDTATA